MARRDDPILRHIGGSAFEKARREDLQDAVLPLLQPPVTLLNLEQALRLVVNYLLLTD